MAKRKFVDLPGLSAFKDKVVGLIVEHTSNPDIHKTSESIISEITYNNIVDALGYIPLGQDGLGVINFEVDENNDLIMIAPDGYESPLEIDEDGYIYYCFA